MTRSQRLLAILEYMRGRSQPVTAAQLAQRFHISERSIYRDISTLNHQGAMIEGSAGVGYVLKDGFFLPPLSFSAEEAAAIVLGLRFVVRRGDAALAQAARAARAKMAVRLSKNFGSPGSPSVPLLVGPCESGDSQDKLLALRDAIVAECIVEFSYQGSNDRTLRRRVWPVAIGWFDRVEMLAGWCELRGAFRHFRIDRIENLSVLDLPLPQPHHTLWHAYLRTEPGLQF